MFFIFQLFRLSEYIELIIIYLIVLMIMIIYIVMVDIIMKVHIVIDILGLLEVIGLNDLGLLISEVNSLGYLTEPHVLNSSVSEMVMDD